MTDYRNIPVKDIAALVRADIRTKVADWKQDGTLPADAKVSVRYTTASLMQAIDVTVTVPKSWAYNVDRFGNHTRTKTAGNVSTGLRAVLATYNTYPSPYSDRPRFYGDVAFDHPKEV